MIKYPYYNNIKLISFHLICCIEAIQAGVQLLNLNDQWAHFIPFVRTQLMEGISFLSTSRRFRGAFFLSCLQIKQVSIMRISFAFIFLHTIQVVSHHRFQRVLITLSSAFNACSEKQVESRDCVYLRKVNSKSMGIE